ncbi:MAG: cytochrome c, partial [Chitinophagaceae bacterium]|nr:cytochrome c [Chitinophagaceae bacterium]
KKESGIEQFKIKEEPVGEHGVGDYAEMEIPETLDDALVASGKNSYDVKCVSCHKLTDERLVGPGWKGVTSRRTPGWIMNFITNVDEMLDKDPESQVMLEQCLVRMPNQGVQHDEARALLEFMRKNDK